MTIKAILFDLDDTLLRNDMTHGFAPVYLQKLAEYAVTCFDGRPRLNPAALVQQVVAGSQVMMANTAPLQTLERQFADVFYPALGVREADLLPVLAEFYDTQFGTLDYLTGKVAAARPVVEWALGQGYRVVIATNPLFPRRAVEWRLTWAGIPPVEFPDLEITSYERYHFAKPQPAYYAEILARLGVRPDEALMVGNDWGQDILPAAAVGLHVWWIAPPDAAPPATNLAPSGQPLLVGLDGAPSMPPTLAGHGTLAALADWLQADPTLEALDHTPGVTPIALLARLKAVVAALNGLTDSLSEREWYAPPSDDEDEWCASEVVQHLIEAETAMLQPRITAVLTSDNPFIAAVDLSVVAADRAGDFPAGATARAAFTRARLATLDRLSALPGEAWLRPCRHTLFGPTRLHELVEIALDHDLQHLGQIRETLAGVGDE